jgi:hypothetical protein
VDNRRNGVRLADKGSHGHAEPTGQPLQHPHGRRPRARIVVVGLNPLHRVHGDPAALGQLAAREAGGGAAGRDGGGDGLPKAHPGSIGPRVLAVQRSAAYLALGAVAQRSAARAAERPLARGEEAGSTPAGATRPTTPLPRDPAANGDASGQHKGHRL